MSIFASRTSKTIDVPFDPPHTVTIQRLAGRHLAKAASAHQMAAIESYRELGGAEFQKELEALGDQAAKEEAVRKAAADPMHGYDRDLLILHGLKSWSYTDEADPATMLAITAEAIADLTDDAAEWLAREILRYTKPSLFQTAEEAEADVKNG